MVDLDWEKARLERDNPTTPLGRLVQAGAAIVCPIYRSYPARVFSDTVLTPEAVKHLKTAVYDQLCYDPAKPNLPTYEPTFKGGQCPGVAYTVNGTYTNSVGTNQSFTTPGLQAPILGVQRINDGVAPYTEAYAVRYGAGLLFRVTGYDVPGGTKNCLITSVTPPSGVTDNCGNAPPSFAPAPSEPTASDYGKDVVLPSLPGLPAIPVPVFIRPTVNLPAVNFRPEINVDVGGINVNFSAGGVSFSASVSPTVNFNVPSYPPGVPAPSNPVTSPVAKCDVDNKPVLDAIQAVKDCACEQPYDVGVTVYPPASSKVIALPEDCLSVQLELTTLNPQPKVEFGGDAPDVYYAGWAWFNVSGYNIDRDPIDALGKTFIPPKGATGFSYTCRVGYQAKATVSYKT